MVAPYSTSRASALVAPLPGFRYVKHFSEDLFVKKFFRGVKIKFTPSSVANCVYVSP
jgi:hypothetical protein